MRSRIVLARALLLFLVFTAPVHAKVSADESWEVYGGDFGGTKFSRLDQINRDTVGKLKPAWIYRCDDMREDPPSTIRVQSPGHRRPRVSDHAGA
jgi:glucose dehydrogenase